MKIDSYPPSASIPRFGAVYQRRYTGEWYDADAIKTIPFKDVAAELEEKGGQAYTVQIEAAKQDGWYEVETDQLALAITGDEADAIKAQSAKTVSQTVKDWLSGSGLRTIGEASITAVNIEELAPPSPMDRLKGVLGALDPRKLFSRD